MGRLLPEAPGARTWPRVSESCLAFVLLEHVDHQEGPIDCNVMALVQVWVLEVANKTSGHHVPDLDAREPRVARGEDVWVDHDHIDACLDRNRARQLLSLIDVPKAGDCLSSPLPAPGGQ